MRQTRFRQIDRLQKQALRYIERKQQIEREWRRTPVGAAAHAAILAFLIRYGNPKIDEPLSMACQRCGESDAWKTCCDKFPSTLLAWNGYLFEPHDRDSVTRIGMPIRHAVISIFPGRDEKAKLNAAFASAPPWFIWFTFGDYTAALLGLTLPNLSGVSGFTRSKENFNHWWGLPKGAFERDPWPYGPETEPLAHVDLSLLRPAMRDPNSQMTRREQRRAVAAHMKSLNKKHTDGWPWLPAPAILEMPVREELALFHQAGRLHDGLRTIIIAHGERVANVRKNLTK
jgi:hypothetical protein